MRLPNSKIHHNHGTSCIKVELGFDTLIKKYKVVRFFNDHDCGCTICEVITIAGNDDTSWRQLNHPTFFDNPEIYREGVNHQGSMYWIVQANNRMFILELDLTTEVFAEIRFNHVMKRLRNYKSSCQLQSFGQHLTDINGRLLQIWRLVKQDTGESGSRPGC
jgi:F-box interacting protein